MKSYVLLFLGLCMFVSNAYSAVVVQLEIQRASTIDDVYLKLFDVLTPLTVTNFLKYTTDGDFTNSFIHRSDTNFVLQTGGYTFDPSAGSFSYDSINDIYPGGLQLVPRDPPVTNEFSKSNTRGTIAMAKTAGNPDSATSEWFVNLGDNSSNLDTQNEGFTVFGEVIGGGMNVIDSIATPAPFDVTDIHPAFGELPLINLNYSAGDTVLQENLVRVNAVSQVVSISTLYNSTIVGESDEPEDVDFGLVVINQTVIATTEIKNVSSASIMIGNVADTDTLSSPFMLTADNCSNILLGVNSTCTLVIEFMPLTDTAFDDSINIMLPGLSYTLNVHGEGAVTTPETNISVTPLSYDFGEVEIFTGGIPANTLFEIINTGNLNLDNFTFDLAGTDIVDFSQNTNCITRSPIKPGENCLVQVLFKPLTTGTKSATLVITSNDPDQGVINIPLSGESAADSDGIPVAIEDAAPNNGDGNFDGVLDSTQNNVASLRLSDGSYVTIVSTQGSKFRMLSLLDAAQMVSPPNDIAMNSVLQFTLADIPFTFGEPLSVGLILPSGNVPKTYYAYGPTTDNSNPHWHEFLLDGVSGAEIIGNATVTSISGESFNRSIIRLWFTDGSSGDDDLTVNSVILSTGGPALPVPGSSSSGKLSYLTLLLFVLAISYLRIKYPLKSFN